MNQTFNEISQGLSDVGVSLDQPANYPYVDPYVPDATPAPKTRAKKAGGKKTPAKTAAAKKTVPTRSTGAKTPAKAVAAKAPTPKASPKATPAKTPAKPRARKATVA
jgi:hypothetical protein